MVKTLKFLALVLFITAFSAFALFPEPVSGRIQLTNYPYPEGLVVQQTNVRTALTYETTVDETGFFVLDWANYPHFAGDQVIIKIKVCAGSAECQRSVTLDGDPKSVSWVVNEATPVGELIKEEVTYYYVCSDGSVKTVAADCPIVSSQPTVKEIKTEKYVYFCQDGSLASTAEDCPDDPWKKTLGVVSVLLVVLSTGLGALYLANRRKYKWVPGFLKVQQKNIETAKKLHAEGKEEAAMKKLQTVEKAANTSIKKYLQEEVKK